MSSWEVQKGIYSKMSADVTLMGMVANRIYDEPPANLVYPYILIGDSIDRSDNRIDKNGYSTDFHITIYTKPGLMGFSQAKQIEEQINKVLNLQTITISNYDIISCRFDNSLTSREDDKRIIDMYYIILTSDQ